MSCMEPGVLAVWLCACCIVVPASCNLLLNKCCPQDQQLVIMADRINCTHIPDESEGKGEYWWLPEEVINNDTQSLLQVSYGRQPSCDIASMDLLRFNKSRAMTEFTLLTGSLGGVELSVLKESTLHDPELGRDKNFLPHDFCLDVVGERIVALLCPCHAVPCVRKCCHDGQLFDPNRGQCQFKDYNAEGDFVDWVPKVDNYTEYYRLVSRLPTCDRYTSHSITIQNDSQFLLSPDGSLQDLETGEVFLRDVYCGTHSVSNEEMLIFCMKPDTEAAAKRIVYGSAFLFGATCLLVTVAITAILPDMRKNLQGKMALAHNLMLFVGYLVTGISQLSGHVISKTSCEVLSLIIQFTILAAFFWLNAMCIDISWTFSGLQPLRGVCLQNERIKFILYSLYAWGGTVIISMATIIVENLPNITRFKPSFGTSMCFFNDREAELLFFYGPMAVILIINLLLFVFIACKLFSANKQMKASCSNKKNLVLYGKLFVLMGVTWVTEVISWAVGGPNYFWYFTDLINLLRSVFIFVIFCCKRSVYVQLRDKVLRALGRSAREPNPSFSAKTHYSTDSNKKAVAMTNCLANTGTGSPSKTQQQKTEDNTQKNEAFEMT